MANKLTDADEAKLSIELSAIVTFHMPCRTIVDNMPTTISIKIDKNVAVNLLIGTSIIKISKMIIDFNDNVVETKNLVTGLFELVFQTFMRGFPTNISMGADKPNNNILYSDMKKKITATYKLFETVVDPIPPPGPAI